MPRQMEWRTCCGFLDYEVSDCGDLRRLTDSATRKRGWRPRGYINLDGYLTYCLFDDEGRKRPVTAHSLVANAFLGPPPSPDHEVAHENGSRVLCDYRNLRWATRQENHSDIQVHGTALKGERNGRAKLTEGDVIEIRRSYREIKASEGERKVTELDQRYGLARATLINIALGRSWKHVPMERYS